MSFILQILVITGFCLGSSAWAEPPALGKALSSIVALNRHIAQGFPGFFALNEATDPKGPNQPDYEPLATPLFMSELAQATLEELVDFRGPAVRQGLMVLLKKSTYFLSRLESGEVRFRTSNVKSWPLLFEIYKNQNIILAELIRTKTRKLDPEFYSTNKQFFASQTGSLPKELLEFQSVPPMALSRIQAEKPSRLDLLLVAASVQDLKTPIRYSIYSHIAHLFNETLSKSEKSVAFYILTAMTRDKRFKDAGFVVENGKPVTKAAMFYSQLVALAMKHGIILPSSKNKNRLSHILNSFPADTEQCNQKIKDLEDKDGE